MTDDRGAGGGRLRAGIYCRLSLARDGDSAKVEDQARIGRELCRARGWQVAQGIGYPEPDGVYTDNNRSAWQRKRKRHGWDTMLEDVKAGKLDAIVVYHGDRLVRQPRDLEDLLDLSRGKGIRLASPTGTRDLDSDEDQFILGIEANMARRESANTSRRKKSQYDRMRRQGLVRSGGRGGRAYGFATDGVTHVPAECELIRLAATRILQGQSASGAIREMTARGARTPTGREFTVTTLRKMLARPRYAGLMPDGENTAAWPPVLERETWEAVSLILGTRAGAYAYTTSARRWLLSGIIDCGLCGTAMQMRMSVKAGVTTVSYGCVQPGCRKVYRSALLLDAYVSRRVVNRLANPLNPRGVPAHPDFGREFQQLATERAAAEEQVRDYRTSPGRIELLMARLDSIDTRLAELRMLAGDGTRARIMEAHAGITAGQFGALPLGTRRALISACYTVTVLPASKRGPGFRTEDVRLTPR